jgi:hypothetical protein
MGFAVAILLVAGTAGCVASSGQASGASYLRSLQSAHRMNPTAKAVCAKDAGKPISKSTPRIKLLVAANSTLKSVRRILAPGYAVSIGETELTGKKQGFAAICLFHGINHGAPAKGWSYDLPDGEAGFINAG